MVVAVSPVAVLLVTRSDGPEDWMVPAVKVSLSTVVGADTSRVSHEVSVLPETATASAEGTENEVPSA